MKKISLLVILTPYLGGVLSVLAQSVTFVDPVIEKSARFELGVSADQNITEAQIQGIRTLSLVDDGKPQSLSDLSKFTSLQNLYLDYVGDLDLSPVWGLSENLRILEISGSTPTRLAGITDMPILYTLGLGGNKLTTVDFLLDNNFSNLNYLDLEDNYFDLNNSQILSDLEGLKSSISPFGYIDAESMLPKGFQNLAVEKSRVSTSSDSGDILMRGIYELLGIFESTGAN